MIQPLKIGLTVRDITGQKALQLEGVSRQTTVRELVEGLLPRMNLPATDSNQRPLTYQARLEREGRHLHGSEIVGESLMERDELTLSPSITAGAPTPAC